MIIRILLILFMSISLNAEQPYKQVKLSEEEQAFIEAHPKIVLGSDENWAPYIIRNHDNTISGFDKDILDLINKATGANFQLVASNWKSIIQQAKDKKIDGLSTSAVHESRKSFLNFSKPYVNTQKLLVTSINNPNNIKSINDLEGKRVAYQENNLFDKKLVATLDGAVSIAYKSLEDILNALIKGEVDATIGSSTLIYLAKKRELPYIKVVDFIPNSTVNLVFSIRNDYPLALSILNKGIDAIAQEEKRKLNARWFFDSRLFNNEINLTSDERDYLLKNPVLKVQNLKTFAPFNFFENAQPQGYTIDYMKLMAKYMGVELEFVSGKTWAQYLEMLKKNQLHIIPHIAKTSERKQFINYTDFKHVEFSTGMAVQQNSSIKSMSDLRDKTTAVVSKTFMHSYIRKAFPNYKLLLVPTTKRAAEVVSLGQADAAIASLPSLNYYIQKHWYSNLKTMDIKGYGRTTKTALSMGVNKDNILLKSILEKVHLHIPHSEVVQLRQKWMDVQENVEDSLSVKELDYLQKKEIIKMCVLPNWLPFEQIDENGKHKGIGNDIMKIVSEYIDKPIVLLPTQAWAESLQNIRDRKCDILPVAMDVPSRRDTMNFTKPYVKEPFVIATKTDKFYIRDISNLSNKKIGIVKSYAIIEVLKTQNPLIEVVEVKNTQEGLEKVSSGEIFGYVDILPTVAYFIQKHGLFDLKIAGKLSSTIDLSIASRNDEPLLNDIMQKALNTISEEEIRKIVGRWIEIKVQEEFDYRKLFYVIGFFTIIILLVLYKNRSVHLINRKLELANQEIQEQQKMVDKYVLILDTDMNGIITNVNEAYCKATGYSKNDLLGNTHNIMKHPSMSEEFFEHLWTTIRSNLTWQGEITNYTKDKEVKYFNLYIEPKFKDHQKIGYRSISEDITDKKRIEELSVTDNLTSLYNRMKLDEILFMKVEEFKRYGIPFSVVLLDIDNFKDVNDTYGHDIGDAVLIRVARILKNSVRITDVVGRWGGEEFLIICENTSSKNTFTVSEHLRESVAKEEFEVIKKLTISLGVTEFTDDDSLNTLFKRVDKALYEAKNSGKNRSVLL